MVRTQIQLTDQQAKRLKELASENHVSMAELIRDSIDQFLAMTAPVDKIERRQRAIAAAGRFHTGIRDLATEHDRYLAEENLTDWP